MKSKPLFIIFISLIIMCNVPLQATTFTNTTHQQILKNNIDNLTLVQNQIFTLAQKIFFPTSTVDSSIENDLARINNSIDDVNKSLYSYSTKLSDNSSEKRDAFLLINAANYIKSSVYELSSLATQASPSEKMLTLERYFNYRVYASNSIRLVANLLSSK